MMQMQYFSTPTLPWDRLAEEEKLFRRLAALFILIFFIITLIVPYIPLPEKQREEAERIPPRLARLVMEKQKPPPKKVEEKPKEEPKKEEPKKEEPKKEEPKKQEPKPKKEEPKKPQPTRQETAKKQAAAAVAVFDDLADLRDTQDLTSLKTEQQSVTASTSPGNQGATQRALIGQAAIGGSGGVAVAKASSGGGGTGKLGAAPGSGMQASQVKSSIADPAAKAAEKRGTGGKARRTTEDVQLVFDRNKGTIYSLYRRALRENPALEGTVVLRLQIQPNGTVTRCEIVSSELKDPDLERKIVLKVKSINFGKMDVDVWNDTYPISFIPS